MISAVTGFRTSGLRHVQLEEALDGISGAGFGAVEFCLEHPEASQSTLLSAREKGLVVSAVSYHGKRDDHSLRIKQGLRAVDLAERCSVETVVFGSPVTGRGNFLIEADALYSRCSEAGILPAWETEPGTVLNSLEEFYELIAPLGNNAGINLDVGHLHLQGTCTAAHIEALRGRIHHVHLEGMLRGNHRHLVPGFGDIDWKEVVKGLKAADFTGPLVIDLFQLPENWKLYLSASNIALREIIGYSIPGTVS